MRSKEFDTLPNIYLVGPMGAGKTTVGRHLAELLGRQFLDSDHEIERKTGATIPWIFEKEGEQRGIVVYLYTPVEIQLQRTHRDKNRPLLQVENPEQKLRDLLAVRDPLYREVAHYIIETNQGAARDLAQKILSTIVSEQIS